MTLATEVVDGKPTIRAVLLCDHPDRPLGQMAVLVGPDQGLTTLDEVRIQAAKVGWTNSDGNDYCPSCSSWIAALK